MTKNLPAVVGAAVNDVLSLFQLTGANVTGTIAQGAIAAYLCRRAEEARNVLLEEFAEAQISSIEVANEDELGGILFRYFNAIRDNSARLNLRLMAKVMVGQAQRDRLFADDFVRYANLIAMLSRDEVLAVALLHRKKVEMGGRSTPPDITAPTSWELIERESVPSVFPTIGHLRAACTSAMRSGLVMTGTALDELTVFTTTPVMDELAELSDFQDALRKEGIRLDPDTQ